MPVGISFPQALQQSPDGIQGLDAPLPVLMFRTVACWCDTLKPWDVIQYSDSQPYSEYCGIFRNETREAPNYKQEMKGRQNMPKKHTNIRKERRKRGKIGRVNKNAVLKKAFRSGKVKE